METLITASLERQFGQIPGLVTMTSQSSEGTSQITLQFDLNRSMDSAAQDVQAAINAAAGTLPANLPYPPVYAKVNPADAPILTLALTSDTLPIDAVSDAADTLLQPKLSEIDGVGRVTVQGGLRPAVRVRVDPARLAAYGLAMEDVRTAVANANVNGAKGGFDGPRLAFALGANDQLVDAAAYQQPGDRLAQRRAGAAVRRRQRDQRRGERPRRRLVQGPAGGGARHPAPARRQHRADRAAGEGTRCRGCRAPSPPASSSPSSPTAPRRSAPRCATCRSR